MIHRMAYLLLLVHVLLHIYGGNTVVTLEEDRLLCTDEFCQVRFGDQTVQIFRKFLVR